VAVAAVVSVIAASSGVDAGAGSIGAGVSPRDEGGDSARRRARATVRRSRVASGAGRATVRRSRVASVLAAIGELALLVAPAREVALDQLALPAREGEPATRFVDGGEPAGVRGLRPQVLADRSVVLAAPTLGVPLGQGEQRGRGAGEGERRAGGHGVVERRARGVGAAGGSRGVVGGFAGVTDGGGERAAVCALVSVAHRPQRRQPVLLHGPMLHSSNMVVAGGAPIDRYVVMEHLSEGGMGQIFVGKKLGAGGFEMEVVLKQLLPEFTQQPEFLDLFIREAKLSGTLDHANIVHTIDFVSHSGEFFIVMEYLPGGDLRTLLKRAKRRGQRFSPAAAIRIAREVLSALAYAHVKRDFDGTPLKLIHRDVSPSNILVSYAGEVKLTDFGIAKAATHNSLFYKVKGKIGYMSPEQAKSEPLDHRSDLYSLAVCLYEVITGERLFVHAGLTTSADEIYSQPVPPVSRKVPGLTPELDAIMAKALAISPDKRFQTAGEFQEALNRCAHRNGLLMSAPDLAEELRAACGDFEQWRTDDDDDDLGYAVRAGTEVYDAEDDEDAEDDDDGDRDEDDDDGELDVGPASIHSLAAARGAAARGGEPPARPKEVSRFHGVELTSIINMIDLEGGTLDSGPRGALDSGPRGAPEGELRTLAASPTSLSMQGQRPNPTQHGMGVPSVSDLLPTAPRGLPAPGPMGGPGSMGPMGPMGQMGGPGSMGPMGGPGSMGQMGGPGGMGPMGGPGGPGTMQRPMQARPLQTRPQTDPRGTPVQRRGNGRSKPSWLRPWLVIAVILVLTGIVVILVAMSGPDVPPVPSK